MKTYRYRGHSRSDPAKYRPDGELDRWKARDPIELLGARAGRRGRTRRGTTRRRMRTEIQAEIDAAAERAADSPLPDPRGDAPLCLRRLSRPPSERARTTVAEMTYREAINAALDDALAADPAVSSWARTSAPTAASSRRTSGSPRTFRAGCIEHADLRERVPRRRARDGRRRPAPGRRDHVRRLPADGRRRDRQPAAQVPLHVGRPVRRAGDGPVDRRRDRPLRDAALRDRRELVHAACPACASRPPARPGPRTAAPGRDPRTATRCSSSSTRASTGARAPSARRRRRARQGRGRPRRQRRHDRRHAADGRARSQAARAARRRGRSTPRSSTCAGCARSTSRPSGRSVEKTGRLRRRRGAGPRRRLGRDASSRA